MTIPEKMRLAIAALDGSAPLPSMGDPRKTYPVLLTEPEVNAIHAAFGFMQSAGRYVGFARYAEHYGPTMKALSERLGVLDDDNAPFSGAD